MLAASSGRGLLGFLPPDPPWGPFLGEQLQSCRPEMLKALYCFDRPGHIRPFPASMSLPSWSNNQEHHPHPHPVTPSINVQWKCPPPLQIFQNAACTPHDPDLVRTGPVFGKYVPHLPTLDLMLLRGPHRVEPTIAVGS